MSVVTVTIPNIEGVSPAGLKRAIDYLILEKQKKVISNLTTRIVVKNEAPAQEYGSRDYEVVSREMTSSDGKRFVADEDPVLKSTSRVSISYPDQKIITVYVQANKPSEQLESPDILSLISEEIKQYLSLFNVEVVIAGELDNADNEPDLGLELSVCIPKLPISLCERLKMDIECIIGQAKISSQTPIATTGQYPVQRALKHRLSIKDSLHEPTSCIVKVALLGDAKKNYFETMWDINRKIKSYMTKRVTSYSEVDSPFSPSDGEVLKKVILYLPHSDGFFMKVNLHKEAVQQIIVQSMSDEKIPKTLQVILQQINSDSGKDIIHVRSQLVAGIPPRYVSYYAVLCDNIHKVLGSYLEKITKIKSKTICVSCDVTYQSDQVTAHGHIHYVIQWHQGKITMQTTYPEELNGSLQDLDSCAKIFKEGLNHVLSQCDLSQLKTQQDDPSCPEKSSTDEVDFHPQVDLKGSRTVYTHIDPHKSKNEILQSILMEMCKKING